MSSTQPKQNGGVTADELSLDLDRLVADFAAEHRCPSISWGVVTKGQLASGLSGPGEGELVQAVEVEDVSVVRCACLAHVGEPTKKQ